MSLLPPGRRRPIGPLGGGARPSALHRARIAAIGTALVAAVWGGTSIAPRPARAQSATTEAARAYEQARGLYFALRGSKDKQRFRHNWLRVIGAFRSIYESHPASPEAPRAAYTAGELWRGLYDISRVGDDLDQALIAYERVGECYQAAKLPPAQWQLGDDALYQRAQIHLRRGEKREAARELQELLRRFPAGDMTGKADRALATVGNLPPEPAPPPESQPDPEPRQKQLTGRSDAKGAQVTEIKAWTNADYTRVAMMVSGRVQARSGQVPAQGNKPRRIYVDLSKATLAPGASVATLTDTRVAELRAAQFDANTVRVVLELGEDVTHRVMEMDNPRRIILDVFSARPAQPSAAAPAAEAPRLSATKHVVIDPGHGGKDHGAAGPGKLREKEVVLAIAKAVAKKLKEAGIEVTLTRTDDTYLSLEERTALANQLQADVFVSIHANANNKKTASGIETYYLNVTDDRYSLRLAAVENKTSEEAVSELQLILTDLSTKAHTQESMVLAKRIQEKMVAAAKPHHPKVRDLGVKGSLFYVLLGARMPAVLVETSFLTNPTEAKLLANNAYRNSLASAIASAVQSHLAAPVLAVDP